MVVVRRSHFVVRRICTSAATRPARSRSIDRANSQDPGEHMASPRTMNPDQLQDLQVIDSTGTKVGKVSTIYLDNDNGLPEGAAVKSGMFGSHETLVPLAEAQAENDALKVPYSKDAIKNAPHWDPSQELSVDDEKQPFDHYGVSYSGETVTADENQGKSSGQAGYGHSGQTGHGTSGQAGHETSGHAGYETA